MRVKTVQSDHSDAMTAWSEIAAGLALNESGPADLLFVYFSASHAESFPEAGLSLAGRAAHGSTSCLGVMTEKGHSLGARHGIGVLALHDPDGSYGSAYAHIGADPSAAARAATQDALMRAGRAGESPALVFMSAEPGCEEALLDGIRDVVGGGTPIMGASSADDEVAGHWRQFCNGKLLRNAVVVTVLFPSVPSVVTTAFQGGFAPDGQSGIVTRASNRRLYEIDHKPAAEVYGEWIGKSFGNIDARRSILAESTLFPLGVAAERIAGVPFHLLLHPSALNPDGSIELFADVREGERVWQMIGTPASLVARAGDVVRQACRGQSEPGGALVVYCGGCLLAQPEQADALIDKLREGLEGVPFLAVFSFGEQGSVGPQTSRHANLMISCTVFGSPSQ